MITLPSNKQIDISVNTTDRGKVELEVKKGSTSIFRGRIKGTVSIPSIPSGDYKWRVNILGKDYTAIGGWEDISFSDSAQGTNYSINVRRDGKVAIGEIEKEKDKKAQTMDVFSNILDLIQGPRGDDGIDGDHGDDGESGKDGENGDKGEQGEQGPIGPKGDRGEQGNDGRDGDHGEGFTAGGKKGQVAIKASNDDFDITYSNVSEFEEIKKLNKNIKSLEEQTEDIRKKAKEHRIQPVNTLRNMGDVDLEKNEITDNQSIRYDLARGTFYPSDEVDEDKIEEVNKQKRLEQRAIGVYGKDFSVFQATSIFDETEQAIRLQINATGVNDPDNVPVGQRRYNNITRKGNKAIYAISKMVNNLFNEFRQVDFSIKNIASGVDGNTATASAYMNVIINPTNSGDSTDNRIIVFTPTILVALGNGYSKYRAKRDDSIFTIVGTPLGTLSSTPNDLAQFFIDYPNAVIVGNGHPTDAGMPEDDTVYGVLFAVGGSTTGDSGPYPYKSTSYITDINLLNSSEFCDGAGGVSPLTTKGDLYTYSTVDARLGVGTNGQSLVADSAEATGLKWATPAGSGDMLAATYDTAGITEQVAGLTATQTLTSKTINTSSNTITVVEADISDYDPSSTDMARIAGSTYSTIQSMQDLFHSAGTTSGGVVTDAGSNTIDVTAGTGLIRATDSDLAEIVFCDWGSATGASVPINTSRYVGVEYNAGSPQVLVSTTNNFNANTVFHLATVVNEGGTIHIAQTPHKVGDHAGRMILRSHETMGIQRDNITKGLVIGETGTRNLTITTGNLWDRLAKFTIAAIDTSVAGSFDRYYSDGAGGHTKEASQTQWNNTQYDDGTGTLATLGANKWSVQWLYVSLDGDILCMYGTVEHGSLAAAEDESMPTDIPDRISKLSILIGRVIFKKSDATLTKIESSFDVSFGGAIVTDHGSLGGLTDDDHTQYILADGTRAFTGDQDFAASSDITFGGTAILSDSAGTMTLSNIDDVDATTRTTLEGVGKQTFQVLVFDAATDVATGDGKAYISIPTTVGGMDLIGVHAEVLTAGTTGTTDIQIHNITQTADMLSTKITIDSTETGSDTAVTAAVIDTANDDVADYDVIRVDVDAVSTTAPKGLIVTLILNTP